MATCITVVVGFIGVAAMLGAIYLVEGHHPECERELIRADQPKPDRR
jgi:hypothetical protein